MGDKKMSWCNRELCNECGSLDCELEQENARLRDEVEGLRKLKGQPSVVGWVAKTATESYLCLGNLNPGMSYHIGVPWANPMDSFVIRMTREDVREDCRKWKSELIAKYGKLTTGSVAKPTKVRITWGEE